MLLKAHNHLFTKFLICQLITNRTYIYNPNINLSNFVPLKPSRSGDISLLVFKISKEAVKQQCFDQKIQCLYSQNTHISCVYCWYTKPMFNISELPPPDLQYTKIKKFTKQSS